MMSKFSSRVARIEWYGFLVHPVNGMTAGLLAWIRPDDRDGLCELWRLDPVEGGFQLIHHTDPLLVENWWSVNQSDLPAIGLANLELRPGFSGFSPRWDAPSERLIFEALLSEPLLGLAFQLCWDDLDVIEPLLPANRQYLTRRLREVWVNCSAEHGVPLGPQAGLPCGRLHGTTRASARRIEFAINEDDPDAIAVMMALHQVFIPFDVHGRDQTFKGLDHSLQALVEELQHQAWAEGASVIHSALSQELYSSIGYMTPQLALQNLSTPLGVPGYF